MEYLDFKQIEAAWNSIKRIEQLNTMEKRNGPIAFMAVITPPFGISRKQPDPPDLFALTPAMNQIIKDALMKYKSDLEARMEALKINDTTAMPISN